MPTNCPECGKESHRKKPAKYCSNYCAQEARRKRLISQRQMGDCADCGLSKLLINGTLRICFRCKAKRVKASRPPEWEAKKYVKRKENSFYEDEANRLWNRVRMVNDEGGGWCCECGLKLNSYNRTQYCESCKRAVNRLILTLSKAAGLV